MNLFLKIMIFVGLAVQLVQAGNAQVSNDKAIIPEGEAEGVAISKQKLASAIASRFNSISEVTAISISDDFYVIEGVFGILDRFTVSFNIRTTNGDFYENIQCKADSTTTDLVMVNCKNDHVVLTPSQSDTSSSYRFKEISISLGSIALEGNRKYFD